MKSSAAVLMALVTLAGCNPAEMPMEPPPAPQAPTVTINVKQDSITAGQPVSIEVCGTRFSQIAVSPGGFVVAKCDTLTDYPQRPTRYRAFASGPGGNAQASDSVTVRQTVTPPPPPLDSIARIRVELEDGTTGNVEMRERIPLSGATVTTILNQPTPYRDSIKVDGSALVYRVGKTGFATKRVKVEPIPRQVNLVLVALTPLPTVVSDSGVLNVYSSPKGMRAKLYTAFYGTLVTTQTTDFDRKVKAGPYVIVCEDPTDKRMADTAYAVVPAGGFDNAVCDNPLRPELPAPPPAPVTKGTLLVACNIATQAMVRTYGTNGVVAQAMTNFERELEAGFYTVTYTAPAGYTSKPVTVAVNAGARTVANCELEKEVAPPPPPPPPPTTGTLVLTDNIEGPVEMELRLAGGVVGNYLTDKVLTGMPPGEYTGKCVKPGSGGRIIGDARVVLVAGQTATLRCIMNENPAEKFGRLNVRSDPPNMVARISRVVGDNLVFWREARTNEEFDGVPVGLYHVRFTSPEDTHNPCESRGEVKEDQTEIIRCTMQRRENP